jgi:hypothetical protein
MSFRATALKRSPLALILLALGSHSVFAQAADTPIAFVNNDAITVSFVSPQYFPGGSSSSAPSGDDNKWLKIEFHYGVIPKVGDFLDSATFKVWVEGRDLLDPTGKPDEGIAVALTGSVTYVNIPKGKDQYGVFYVHPSTLARYSTKSGSSDFDRKFDVHIDIVIAGNQMDGIDKNKGEADKQWYKSLKVIPNLVYRQDQCPFIIVDAGRYPAIKLAAPISIEQ